MSWMKAADAISGQEGRAYATIKGRAEEMFYVKSIEVTVKKNKKEIRTLGKRGDQHKANGWSGEGKMTLYYVTTLFRQLMLDYIKTGKDTYFDIMITNDDPTSHEVGAQTVILKNVNLDEVIMAKLDVDGEALDEEVSFTFDDVDIIESFKKPTLN
ncbi:phage tail tube protein [Paenibacillus larvae]|uniref:Putative phage protein n=5 Tax=Paenibacillus larvae TaxID=1464 RepID=A0A2L1U452_9BACL|nr:phage tail tube protein [Paenibacillus larvae]AQZ46037.1 phage portal protein [Paenibacillus larvae subsp. pulvifaciens]AVF27681.1 putative phage protein [Paenibacillus larvae subsp. larvae]MCY9677872.1 phage tail tube protein [Paenibacillus larvae]MDR5608466.1 phage tail tube protein [Paenibacillus larvae]